MYKGFYGLREKPFSKTPDPRYLYLSGGHEEALARLQYAVEERELALLTGGIGSGKTTLSRALMDSMGDGYRFCFIFNPILTPVEFLRILAWNMGVEKPPSAKDDLLRELTGRMYRFHADGIVPVVVVDEAQMIPGRDVFDEIRLLTNYQLDDGNLLAVILMGQPELRQKLADPVYEPLCQRIGIHYHLGPLSLGETLHYIDFRLGVAGGAPGLFSPDAVMKVHELTGGVPRRINSMATAALLEGFAREVTLIEGDMIEDLSEELDVHGTGSGHDEPC